MTQFHQAVQPLGGSGLDLVEVHFNFQQPHFFAGQTALLQVSVQREDGLPYLHLFSAFLVTPQRTFPQHTLLQYALPQYALPQQTLPQPTLPQPTLSKNTTFYHTLSLFHHSVFMLGFEVEFEKVNLPLLPGGFLMVLVALEARKRSQAGQKHYRHHRRHSHRHLPRLERLQLLPDLLLHQHLHLQVLTLHVVQDLSLDGGDDRSGQRNHTETAGLADGCRTFQQPLHEAV